MERLRSLLLPEEQLLWTTQRETNYLYRFLFAACGIGGIMIGIAWFFWYVPGWTGTFYFLDTDIVVPSLVLYLAVLACFYIPIFIVVYDALLQGRKRMQQSGMTLADLRHHYEILALTNQRWIQKGIPRSLAIDLTCYPSGTVSRLEDIVSLTLGACERAVVRKVWFWHQISFFVQNAIVEGLAQPLTVRLTRAEVDGLLIPLRQLVPVINVAAGESDLSLLTLR
jgi:hypothetical protein